MSPNGDELHVIVFTPHFCFFFKIIISKFAILKTRAPSDGVPGIIHAGIYKQYYISNTGFF